MLRQPLLYWLTLPEGHACWYSSKVWAEVVSGRAHRTATTMTMNIQFFCMKMLVISSLFPSVLPLLEDYRIVDLHHTHGIGHADLSGLSLFQHFFHASMTGCSFTLHQPGGIVWASAHCFMVFVTNPSGPSTAVCTLSSCLMTPSGPSRSGLMWRSFCAMRESSCWSERRCASSDVVLLTPAINWSMSRIAFCETLILFSVLEASGAICELISGCEKAVEVATFSCPPVGHVWLPSLSVVHAPAVAVQVLSAASGPAQAFGMIRFQHWFSAVRS